MRREDEDEFVAFVASSRQSLLRAVFLLGGSWDEAEDVVQNALVKLYRAWSRVDRSSGGPDGYARTVVRNAFVDGRRQMWRKREVVGLDDATRPEPDSAAQCPTERMALRAALMQLPLKQRQVIVWRYYLGLTERETAAELGLAVGTVKSHSARALARLELILGMERVQ